MSNKGGRVSPESVADYPPEYIVKEATSPEEAVKGIMTKDDYNKQKK